MMKKGEQLVDVMGRKTVPILGVNVHSTNRQEVLNWVLGDLEPKKKGLARHKLASKIIVTPNPEIVYAASTNPIFAQALNRAQVALVDGVGLAWAQKVQDITLSKGLFRLPLLWLEALSAAFYCLANKQDLVVPGRVLFEKLLEEAKARKLKVFLLGGRSRIAERAASKVERMGIGVEWSTGPWLKDNGKPATKLDEALERETIKKINEFSPDFLFVAFGHPKQEFWLDRNRNKLKIKIGMVVGGTLDYFVGDRSIPPEFLTNMGLEWFWRLLTQIDRPRHLKRIFTAVVLFPYEVLKEKFEMKS